MITLAMGISGIWYYEILVEHETVNSALYSKFFRRLTGGWQDNRKHLLVYDDNAKPLLISLSKGISSVSLDVLILPT